MPYAVTADLQRRLGGLYSSLYVSPLGAPLSTEAAEDLEAAAAEIDGKIAKRYAVPVTAGAALTLLKSWNVTLAEELAWTRSGKADIPAGVKARCERVRKCLDDVAGGLMALSGAVESDGDSPSAFVVDVSPPVFGRKKTKGF